MQRKPPTTVSVTNEGVASRPALGSRLHWDADNTNELDNIIPIGKMKFATPPLQKSNTGKYKHTHTFKKEQINIHCIHSSIEVVFFLISIKNDNAPGNALLTNK